MVRHMLESVISVLCLTLFATFLLFIGIPDDNVLAEEPKSNPHELKEKFYQ